MKKIYVVLFSVILIVMYLLHSSLDLSLNAEITPRKLVKAPIEGEWIVDKTVVFGDKNLSDKDKDQWLNKPASFNSKTAVFDDKLCDSPSYKVKLVNAYNYFWDNFKINPKTLGLKEEKVEVITISSKDRYYDEYVKINENSIVKQNEDTLLFFKKSDSNKDGTAKNKENFIDYKSIASAKEKEVKNKSGFLLGLRDAKGSYRTIWISYINKNFMPVTEVNNILLPRMDGFWQLGSDNSLWAYPMKKDINKDNYKNIKEFSQGSSAIINFVGSDYVSIETSDKKLQVLPIDNLKSTPLKFAAALGQGLSNSLLKEDSSEKNTANFNEINWGVFRRAGRWILRSRKNTDEKNYKDFDMSYAITKSMIVYDELYPSFSEIKEKESEAIDAFSSPNRDFDVIITSTDILVLPIKDGKLSDVQNRIRLKKGEVPVMAHWATGSYVDDWAKIAR
ncbi:hypothetical protein HMPREF1982_02436 [Clostridiales bacterium oral taxon 876 str. F0540]|nr:hypothetical protein HMPREF1982_02436 [Clostridiales bacterium oral taxon 876 str. F0540]